MITGELKHKVDQVRDAFWSAGISNPLEVIEQISYLLFIQRLDELQKRRGQTAARVGQPVKNPTYTTETDSLRWSRFTHESPEESSAATSDRLKMAAWTRSR
ncbi:type I restriction-modification system subunit M N-terminal domain-containing protein [Streptomyces sp. NBC_00873]|uniref:type I restriction-modification system subunit M N-terminal domain-containing protein n=1 Tax=unclassified Streptomyces TaxID=2593676 RepID=UPI003867CA9D|nr:type I restriction-modification system subunit M N-terminal domain-containing protein [Streptomyces sp. NBC_00873]WTA45861.1 type I restriction-modification system subunit M N-terminal domain-containing protein [Streptomyces sp. NBC_00842]